MVYLNTSEAPKRTGTVDSRETFPYTVYDALRNQHGPLSDVIAYVPRSTRKVAVRYGTQPEEAEGDMVSGAFFSGLGVKFARGHGFTEQDEADHAPIRRLAVCSTPTLQMAVSNSGGRIETKWFVFSGLQGIWRCCGFFRWSRLRFISPKLRTSRDPNASFQKALRFLP